MEAPPGAHKDVRELAASMSRHAKARLKLDGQGPALVATLRLDPSGLREEGGFLMMHWGGKAALHAEFRSPEGATVARVSSSAPVSKTGTLATAGDRLLDDVAAFLADHR